MLKDKIQWAVTQSKAHKHQLLCTFAYCLSFIGLGISVTGLGPTLFELVDLTKSDNEKMGYIMTVKGFGYLMGSMSGRLYDKFDGHKLIFGAIAIASIFFIAVPFVPYVWGQAIVWFGVGAFTGSQDTGANTLVVWVWREKVAPFMQLLHFSFGVGAVLSPVILAALLDKPLYIQYLSLAIPYALTAIPILLFKSPRNSPSVQEVEMVDNMKDVLITDSPKGESFSIDDDDNKSSSSGIEVEEIQVNKIPATDPVDPVSRRLRIEVVVFAAILLLLDVGYGAWLSTYAQEQLDFSEEAAAYVTAVFWGTFTLGRLAAVGISLVLKPTTMLISDVIGCSLSLCILIIFPNSPTALWICSLGFGFSIASVFPTVISMPQHLGVQITGTDTSWMVVGASAGEMIVPLVIANLQKYYSLLVLVKVVLAVEILGGITFGILLIRVKMLKGGLFLGSNLKGKNNFTKLDDTVSTSTVDDEK